MKRFALIFSLVALAVSCRNVSEQGRLTIPFVREVISQTSSPAHTIMSRYTRNRAYPIYVIGEPEECQRFANKLVLCDVRDNVTGNFGSDGLPDFAGEKIVTLADYAGSPYSNFLDEGRENDLRELVVRECIDALDTLCFLSPYDRQGLGRRSPAKMIVLASSYADTYGFFDVDSLFSAFGCNVKIVNPLRSMLASAKSAKDPCIGVLTRRNMLSAGIYAGCFAFPKNEEEGADQLISFLDNYIAAGYTKPLSSIIIDDPEVSLSEMALTLERILSVMNEESFTYSRIISSDFRIIDPESTIASECYDIMRKENIFTHYIAFPKEEKLMSIVSSDSPGYTIIPFNEKFLQPNVQIDSTARGN